MPFGGSRGQSVFPPPDPPLPRPDEPPVPPLGLSALLASEKPPPLPPVDDESGKAPLPPVAPAVPAEPPVPPADPPAPVPPPLPFAPLRSLSLLSHDDTKIDPMTLKASSDVAFTRLLHFPRFHHSSPCGTRSKSCFTSTLELWAPRSRLSSALVACRLCLTPTAFRKFDIYRSSLRLLTH